MRYTGPKGKKARRLGQAFTAKEAKVLQRRPTPPGQHGQGRARLSEYGLQLKEKQKAKFAYGIQEKQFLRYFEKARTTPGVTGDILIGLLETRLDNVVFRLGLADTRAQARQLVNHGFFEVNGKPVDIPSFQVKVGNTVTVKKSKQKSTYIVGVKPKLGVAKVPDWLDLQVAEFSGKVLSKPTVDQGAEQINTQLIIEHYSRI